jgi:predicted lipase
MKALYFLVGTRDLATSLVESTSKEYPDYSLVVTGHSLGAAQSGYAAAEFRANGTNATLYNYGGPHLGDATLQTLLLVREVTTVLLILMTLLRI